MMIAVIIRPEYETDLVAPIDHLSIAPPLVLRDNALVMICAGFTRKPRRMRAGLHLTPNPGVVKEIWFNADLPPEVIPAEDSIAIRFFVQKPGEIVHLALCAVAEVLGFRAMVAISYEPERELVVFRLKIEYCTGDCFYEEALNLPYKEVESYFDLK